MNRPIRIANCSGFAGDRREAIREILDGDPVDVITGDYLAEMTIATMVARRMADKGEGYSVDLLVQLEGCLDEILERGIKLVVNAGGFDPAGLAGRIRELAGDRQVRIAYLEGDDLLGRLGQLQKEGHRLDNMDTGAPLSEWGLEPTSASAYLGAWGIVDGLAGGADVVVCPRVTDASLLVGAAAWHHEWKRDDWDRLAAAVVAGHIIECGPQATGGNFSGFERIPGMSHPGFPIAEIEENGDAVITKQPGIGGGVTTDTVTAQLLYEIQGPIYLNPDVTVDFRDVTLTQEEPDKVRVTGSHGTPPPPTTKVAITAAGGWENSFYVYLCGLSIDAKAALVEAQARDALAGSEVELFRVDRIGTARQNADTIDAATAGLRLVGRSDDPKALFPMAFYRRVHSTILASIPGFHAEGQTMRATRPSRIIEYWPALLEVDVLDHVVIHDDGSRRPVEGVETAAPPVVPAEDGAADGAADGGPTEQAPLGAIVEARSGDKGGNSNLGIWSGEQSWPWLRATLTTERMRSLFPETAGLKITRHEFPKLRSVHFVFHGFLGDGCSSNGRLDALGKSVGEFVRSRELEIPSELLRAAADERGAPVLEGASS
jgi:Acyclic terpene utilisation family protein AtuA